MIMRIHGKKTMAAKALLSASLFAVLSLTTACQDDTLQNTGTTTGEQTAADRIAFTTVVSSAQQASRADATIVNKGETTLLPTSISKKKVGIFGAYTGQHTWAELVTLSQNANPTPEEQKTLNQWYSANQMYNVPATIESSGSLTYSPLQFWPNNALTADNTQHEYMTFWAYYPYNETSALGTYGISMTNDAMGEGKGMGKVKFVMHPDAAQQNDFLISAPVVDCNRDKYPLQRTDTYTSTPGDTPSDNTVTYTTTYDPKPVQFRLYHMLAQVRFYAFIRGSDKMVYMDGNHDNVDDVADETWLDDWVEGTTDHYGNTYSSAIVDAYGNVYFKKAADALPGYSGYSGYSGNSGDYSPYFVIGETQQKLYTKQQFLDLKLKVPDEGKCVRWDRNTLNIWDVTHTRRRADITYQMQLNNIRTTTTLYPEYSSEGTTIKFDEPTTLGSATVNHYIMNPYWFTFQEGQRVRINDNYMFGYFEDTPVYHHLDATSSTNSGMNAYADVDGENWSAYTYDLEAFEDPLYYLADHNQRDSLQGLGNNATRHYNYAPGNILMVVPQKLSDDDVPHVIITAKGKQAEWSETAKKLETKDTELSAKVTINMLKMGISWESGYIYCYAFLDDLRPGDDKVRGPESITVLFNKDWYTDQW